MKGVECSFEDGFLRRKRKFGVIASAAITLALIYIILFLPKPEKPIPPEEVPRANYSLEDCKKVDFEIKEISCENKVIKISLFNSGQIDLAGDFLGIIYTPELQAFIGGSTQEILKVNQTLPLLLNFGKHGIINRIELVFQPCPFSTKVIENLNLRC